MFCKHCAAFLEDYTTWQAQLPPCCRGLTCPCTTILPASQQGPIARYHCHIDWARMAANLEDRRARLSESKGACLRHLSADLCLMNSQWQDGRTGDYETTQREWANLAASMEACNSLQRIAVRLRTPASLGATEAAYRAKALAVGIGMKTGRLQPEEAQRLRKALPPDDGEPPKLPQWLVEALEDVKGLIALARRLGSSLETNVDFGPVIHDPMVWAESQSPAKSQIQKAAAEVRAVLVETLDEWRLTAYGEHERDVKLRIARVNEFVPGGGPAIQPWLALSNDALQAIEKMSPNECLERARRTNANLQLQVGRPGAGGVHEWVRRLRAVRLEELATHERERLDQQREDEKRREYVLNRNSLRARRGGAVPSSDIPVGPALECEIHRQRDELGSYNEVDIARQLREASISSCAKELFDTESSTEAAKEIARRALQLTAGIRLMPKGGSEVDRQLDIAHDLVNRARLHEATRCNREIALLDAWISQKRLSAEQSERRNKAMVGATAAVLVDSQDSLLPLLLARLAIESLGRELGWRDG